MMLVHELLQQEMPDQGKLGIRIMAEALRVLQKAVEMAIMILMEMSNHCTIYVKRVTLMDKNIRLVCSLIDIWDPNSWLSTIHKGRISCP